MIRAADGGTVELELTTDVGTGIALEIPPGALSQDTELSVRRLDESEIGDDLAAAPLLGPVFSLEPDGQEFGLPVTMSLTLGEGDLAEASAGFGLPIILLLTRTSDGSLELAANQAVIRAGDGSSATVRGEVTHFSRAYAVKVGVASAALIPPEVSLPVGASFRAAVFVENKDPSRSIEVFDGRWFGIYGALELTSVPDMEPVVLGPGVGGLLSEASFKCVRPGFDSYIASMLVLPQGLEALLEALFRVPPEELRSAIPLGVSGRAECVETDAEVPPGTVYVPAFEYQGRLIPLDQVSYYDGRLYPFGDRPTLDIEGAPVVVSPTEDGLGRLDQVDIEMVALELSQE